MVVMVIICVIAAGVVISVSSLGQDRELETETERLATLMNYAHELAELQTRELGLYVAEHRYRFLAFDPDQGIWTDLADDEALHARDLPDGLQLRLSVEAREVVLNKPTTSMDSDPKNLMPHVMIFSNGDLTPFELTLEREGTDRSETLAPDDQGTIKTKDLPARSPT
jgi:general secretion pathway protein H